MGIDTKNEKLALIGWKQFWMGPLIDDADGVLGNADKQHLLADYPGIGFVAVSIAEGLAAVAFSVLKPGVAFSSLWPKVAFTSKKPEVGFTGGQYG